MADADEIQRAHFEMERVSGVIKKCIPGKPGFGNEAAYAQAYQWLVRVGEAPQIRQKYRKA